MDHFREVHQGTTQEVLFRTLATFQTALQRQVWESVEIDSTNNSIGSQQCLNNKTEWGSSKDPVLETKRNPLTKGLPRAQKPKQTAGNTTKRVRQDTTEGRPSKSRRTTPGTSSSSPPTTPDPATPARSRWGRWQTQLSSPESPNEVPAPDRRRERNRQRPTDSSGLQGPSRLDLSGQGTTGHTHQEREGQDVARATETSITRRETLPPDQRTGQEALPWVLRPRDQRRKGLR